MFSSQIVNQSGYIYRYLNVGAGGLAAVALCLCLRSYRFFAAKYSLLVSPALQQTRDLNLELAGFVDGNFATISLFYDWLFGIYGTGDGWGKHKRA